MSKAKRAPFVLTDTELADIVDGLHLASEALRQHAISHAIACPRANVIGLFRTAALRLERLAERIENR